LSDPLTEGKEGAGPSRVVCGDSEGSVVGDKCLLDTEEGDDGSCHAEECEEERWEDLDEGEEGSAGEDEEEENKLLDKLQSSEGSAVLPSVADKASAINPRLWVSIFLLCNYYISRLNDICENGLKNKQGHISCRRSCPISPLAKIEILSYLRLNLSWNSLMGYNFIICHHGLETLEHTHITRFL
jgi:hypothetical protein